MTIKETIWQGGLCRIEKINKKMDVAAPYFTFLFLFFFVALKASVLGLPFFWDEIVVYALPAQNLFTNGLSQIHPLFRSFPELFFGHPPAYAFSLALAYKIFGATPLVARTFTLAMACLGLGASFQLVSRLTRPWIGFLAVLLLALDPNYFSQSTQVLSDVVVMALVPVLFY